MNLFQYEDLESAWPPYVKYKNKKPTYCFGKFNPPKLQIAKPGKNVLHIFPFVFACSIKPCLIGNKQSEPFINQNFFLKQNSKSKKQGRGTKKPYNKFFFFFFI